MLSKSGAKWFFLAGTALCSVAFIGLTVDTLAKVPQQTNASAITEEVKAGKDLWDRSNCMGCHTLLGEGAYYAPELTLVYERRGPEFIKAMLRDPEAMYPGARRMWKYDFTEAEIDALVAFFAWIGKVDLNGFPPKPTLGQVATTSAGGEAALASSRRPQIFNQMCVACHAIGGQGGLVGPALDGVGGRLSVEQLRAWLRDPPAVKPGTKMPKLPLSTEQIDELAAFLSKQRPEAQP